MALSDAELLALLARAEEGRKGDKGEKGVGIESVNSPEPGKLVINLDDGSRYNFQFPTLKGEQGDKGPRGDAGVGSPGPQGAKGDSGRDGIDGVGIDSALVSGGNLLIGLTNGRAIDAGRVAGPAGPAGAPGADGIGRPGADGRDGRDGAQILTGSGKPDGDLGNPGDLYLDALSEGLNLYQKTSADGWSFVAELRPLGERARYFRKGTNNPTGGGVSGGGEGAGGGGGAVIIKPGPEAPIVDNDNKPIQEGDLWVDINGNHLYVYYNGVWSEVTTCSVGGGSADGDFLKRYGDKITDAKEHSVYEWNEGVRFKNDFDSHIDITQSIEIQANGAVDILGTSNAKLSGSGGTAAVSSQFGTDIACVAGDIKLEAGIFGNGNELVERTITDSDPEKQIVNKQYVDTRYLLKNGDTVNAPGPVKYKWNQSVDVESSNQTYYTGAFEINSSDVNSYCTGVQWFSGTAFRFGNATTKKYLYMTGTEITTDFIITEASSDKSLTTKKYVDDLFDFSQYDELP
jgi:hypothetical protein